MLCALSSKPTETPIEKCIGLPKFAQASISNMTVSAKSSMLAYKLWPIFQSFKSHNAVTAYCHVKNTGS